MANTKEVKGADVFNNAFSSSFAGGDGVSLINTAHPLGRWRHRRKPCNSMADLNETSLEDALIDISTFTDDKGLTISVQATKLVVPPQLTFVADRILNSTLRLELLTTTSTQSATLVCCRAAIPSIIT